MSNASAIGFLTTLIVAPLEQKSQSLLVKSAKARSHSIFKAYKRTQSLPTRDETIIPDRHLRVFRIVIQGFT